MFEDSGILGWIVMSAVLMLVWILLLPKLVGLQARVAIKGMRKDLSEFEFNARRSRAAALRALAKHGRTRKDIKAEFDTFVEFFAIEPVRDDPAGVIGRLDHLLDVRKRRFEGRIAQFAPKAGPEEAANLEMVVEAAMATDMLFRAVRHIVVMVEKMKSYQLAMVVQMQLPILKELSKVFEAATTTFAEGKPIGDGAGAMLAAKFIGRAPCSEPVEGTVLARTRLHGRNMVIIKAKGPGGRVGKPGELAQKIIKSRKVSRIIMVDSALKLEGEKSGDVLEGVGAAIGGPPTEKYKIEQEVTKRKIPVDAIIVKMGLQEAIGPLNDRIAKAVDAAMKRVEDAVRQRTKPGDTVILLGVGNTIAIPNGTEGLPAKFPRAPEEKGLVSPMLLLKM